MCVSDLELLFPTAPNSPITVVTVTQRSSQCEEAAEPDRDQLLQRVCPVTFSPSSPWVWICDVALKQLLAFFFPSVCERCKGNVLLPVDRGLLGRLHRPNNRNSCESTAACRIVFLMLKMHSIPVNQHFLMSPDSSSHRHWVKPHCEQRRSWDIWASTSKLPAPALSFATSWEERLCSLGLFSLMRPLTALLSQDYKDFQTYSRTRTRDFYFNIFCKSKSQHLYLWFDEAWKTMRVSVGMWVCRVCRIVSRTWLKL